jgi:uncharacterized damage-inducible protein DinB
MEESYHAEHAISADARWQDQGRSTCCASQASANLRLMSSAAFPPLEIARHWQQVNDDLVRIVDLVPADKFNWSPSPELWNSQGILIHVPDARDQWLTRDVQDGEEYRNIWTTARTPDDLKRELTRTFKRLQRFLSNQAQLDAHHKSEWREDFDGHWIAFHLLEHDIHHRAELMQRLALLGVDHGFDF